MTHLHRMYLLQTAAILGLVPAAATAQDAVSAPAEATQQNGSAASGGLGDIVVTARRVEERLQDVPLSVTALSSEVLAERQITQPADLSGSVPNLIYQRTTVPALNFNIRGQASGALPNISLDTRIGLYLDGVYIARSQGGTFAIADIERVEVLRGPQGTQFGKNVTGGAVNFITAAPTGVLGGTVEGTVGNFDRRRFRATINTPEMNGFSARFSYVHDEFGGDQRNLTPGVKYGNFVDQLPNTDILGNTYPASNFSFATRPSPKRFNTYNTESVFAALRYEAGGLTVDLKGDYTESKSVGPYTQALGFTATTLHCNSAVYMLGLQYNCGGATGVDTRAAPLTSAAANTITLGMKKRRDVASDLQGASPLKARGVSLTINQELGDNLTVRSITGYRKLFTSGQSDFDGGNIRIINDVWNANAAVVAALFPYIQPGPALLPPGQTSGFCGSCSVQSQRQRQFSQELQLIGSIGESIDFLGGLYYFREKGKSRNIFVANTLSPFSILGGFGIPPLSQTGPNELPAFAFANGDLTDVTSRSQAVYGRVTFRPVPELDIVLGGRYTMDRKRSVVAPTLARQVDDPAIAGFQPVAADRTLKDERFTYDATATYHVTPDLNIYARYATAYLAGGFLRNVAFLPETTKAIEVGLKSEWFDRRLRFNLSGFHQKSKDLQNATINNEGVLFLENIGTSTSKGFEVELEAAPVEGLRLGASAGYTKLENSKRTRQISPPWTVQLNGSYEAYRFANDSSVTLSADANYRSQYNASRYSILTAAGGYDPTVVLPPEVWAGYATQRDYVAAVEKAANQGGYWLTNARVSLDDVPVGSAKGRISFWVRNLFNVQHQQAAANYGTAIFGVFEQDRTYGLDLTMKF